MHQRNVQQTLKKRHFVCEKGKSDGHTYAHRTYKHTESNTGFAKKKTFSYIHLVPMFGIEKANEARYREARMEEEEGVRENTNEELVNVRVNEMTK